MDHRGLLKFSGPTSHALENLENGQLFCQHYTAYNDPFEFWTTIYSGVPDPKKEPDRYLAALRAWGFNHHTVAEAQIDPAIQDNVQEYFEECQDYALPIGSMRQGMRICCFGSEADNLLMWSHYADGLRGFCVALDENAIMPADTNGIILDVAYLRSPPQVDSFIYGVAWDQDWYSNVALFETETAIKYKGDTGRRGEISMYEESGAEARRTMKEIWQHVFAAKPAEWEYERERRLLVQTDRTDTVPILQTYDRKSVSDIILGERMPEAFRAKLLALVREHYPDARVTTARRAQEAYTLIID